tara:strand:+ start:2334 stop:3251 length:918 start_codon:yes stop_codon:yes gene_type:complete
MLSNKYTQKHEELLSEIESVGLNTKAAQKDFISNANRIIETVKSDIDRVIRMEMVHLSDAEKDAYFNLNWKLPTTVYVHQYEAALVKIHKAAKINPVFNRTIEALESVRKFVVEALEVKAMTPMPRMTRSDVQREAHEARWKKLPKAAQQTVDSIIDSVTVKIEERHQARKVMLCNAQTEVKKELNTQPDYKSRKVLKSKLAGQYGIALLGLLLGSDKDLDKVIEDERLGEYRKIRYAATQRLGEYTIDEAVAKSVRSGADGIECEFKLYNKCVAVATFEFKAIFAGGYNIQRLHVRTIFNIKAI